MNFKCIVMLVVALILWPSIGWSTTTTIGANKDATLFSDNPSNSAGGGPGFFVGRIFGSGIRRALIEFDIAANVPAGATITAAQMTLHIGKEPSSAAETVNLRRLTADWGEGTIAGSSTLIQSTGKGFAANTGDATWNNRFAPSTAWTAAGAASDISATVSASASVTGPANAGFTWGSTASMVSDVQGWLNNPSTNFGWLLLSGSEGVSGSAKAFYSRSATANELGGAFDVTWRPALAITYALPPSGDYNGNTVVDAGDYAVWRKTFNLPASPAGSGADGDQSGTIGDGDYTYWRARFGNVVAGLGTGGSIPEPTTFDSALIGLAAVMVWRITVRD